jgi:hypothetical protein
VRETHSVVLIEATGWCSCRTSSLVPPTEVPRRRGGLSRSFGHEVQQRVMGSRIVYSSGELDLRWRTSSPRRPPETPRRRGGPGATAGHDLRQPRSHPGSACERRERESAAANHVCGSRPSPLGAEGFQVRRPDMNCGTQCLVTELS